MIDHTELIVIGGGPAGIEAAVNAARAGVSVVLIDAYPSPGGQYYKQLPTAFSSEGNTPWQNESREVVSQLSGLNITVYSNTIVWGVFREGESSNWCVTLYGTGCPGKIFAQSIVITAGAYDRSIPFPGWTLAGVMTAGAVQTMIKYQRVLPGKRFLLSGTGPLQLAVAAQLLQAGAQVEAILEGSRNLLWRGIPHVFSVLGHLNKVKEGYGYLRTISSAKTPIRLGWSVVEACGEKEVEEAVIARLDLDWKPIRGTEKTVAVDTVVVGYNLLPSNEITRLLGCEHEYDPFLGGYLPRRNEDMETTIPGIYAAGDGAGIGGVDQSRLEGRVAGLSVAEHLGKMDASKSRDMKAPIHQKLKSERKFAQMLGKLFTPGDGLFSLARGETIICRCENVTLDQIDQAVLGQAKTINDLKNITRVGMGHCQGRTCTEMASRILATRTGKKIDEVGTLRVRPPIHPVPLDHLARQDE